MLRTTHESLTASVSRERALNVYDHEDKAAAKAIFSQYVDRNVIIGSQFEDDVWVMSNQTEHITFTLSFDDSGFVASEWLGCGSEDYRECVKAYIVHRLGELQLSTLEMLVRQFNRLGGMSAEEASTRAVAA